MGYHRNTLLSSDEGNIMSSKPDHTEKIFLVNLENISLLTTDDKLVCHAQDITTVRYQGRHRDLKYPVFT